MLFQVNFRGNTRESFSFLFSARRAASEVYQREFKMFLFNSHLFPTLFPRSRGRLIKTRSGLANRDCQFHDFSAVTALNSSKQPIILVVQLLLITFLSYVIYLKFISPSLIACTIALRLAQRLSIVKDVKICTMHVY